MPNFCVTSLFDSGRQHWGKAVVDRKLFRGRGLKAEGRFLPKSEVARRFHIWKPMMERMIADGDACHEERIGAGRRFEDRRRSREQLPATQVNGSHFRAESCIKNWASGQRPEGVAAGWVWLVVGLRRGHVNSWHVDDVDGISCSWTDTARGRRWRLSAAMLFGLVT